MGLLSEPEELCGSILYLVIGRTLQRVLYCLTVYHKSEMEGLCARGKGNLLCQVGTGAAVWSLTYCCTLDTDFKRTCTRISIFSWWHRNCICFPPNNQIQRATLGQTKDDCALQAFPAGWLEAELLYIGISDAIHAVYSRNYLKQLIDISRGFWCSKDASLNLTAIIAIKYKGPTQHKHPCCTDLAQRQGISGSIVRERQTRIRAQWYNTTVSEKNSGGNVLMRSHCYPSPPSVPRLSQIYDVGYSSLLFVQLVL